MQFVNRTHRRVVVGSGILLGTLVVLLVAWRLDAAEPKLVQIEIKDKDGTGIVMKATELERGDKTSMVKISRKKRIGSVGSSMFVVQACYEIAKARQCEYFANLKEWDDKDGGRLYIIGFTNKKDADIKNDFGDEFDYKNESGQERKFLSVSQFRPLFERMPMSAKPTSPQPGSSPSK